jgi:predicted DNA-binding ribbon-helix-helix protein
MKSSVIKRSVMVADHKTSISLENEFWSGLKEIAANHHMTLSALVATINAGREHSNLSSAVRLFVLGFYRDQISAHNQISSPEDRSRATPVA